VTTGKVVVEMVVNNDFVLYDSCLACITSTDLVGSKEISIRYKLSKVTLKSGDTMTTFVAPDLMGKLKRGYRSAQR
jgi:ABC-type transporter Mla subunit MlaD